jgi:hypothetical protein
VEQADALIRSFLLERKPGRHHTLGSEHNGFTYDESLSRKPLVVPILKLSRTRLIKTKMSNEQVISNATATKRRTVYLAGALAPNGWRHLLVQGFSDTPIFANEFPVMEGAIFGRFDYVGPFHVRIQTDEHKFEDNSEHTERTWNLRRIAIDKADEVFGWIEPNEAVATIAELAYAAGKGKLVRCALSAEMGYFGPNGCDRLFPEVLRTFKMFSGGLQAFCLSPRMAFARLFKLSLNVICNVPQQSAVYFIEDLSLDRIKIGHSKALKKRFSAIKTANSTHMKTIGTIPGGKHLEAKLHSDFALLRLKGGEWFHATQGLRSFIEMELGLRDPQIDVNDLMFDSCGNRNIPMNYVPKPHKRA